MIIIYNDDDDDDACAYHLMWTVMGKILYLEYKYKYVTLKVFKIQVQNTFIE